MKNLLQLTLDEVKELVLPYTKTSSFLSLFGQKTISNINIIAPVCDSFLSDFTLTNNQFYIGLANGKVYTQNYTSPSYTATATLSLNDTITDSIVSEMSNNEILLFNKAVILNGSLNFQGFLITIN